MSSCLSAPRRISNIWSSSENMAHVLQGKRQVRLRVTHLESTENHKVEKDEETRRHYPRTENEELMCPRFRTRESLLPVKVDPGQKVWNRLFRAEKEKRNSAMFASKIYVAQKTRNSMLLEHGTPKAAWYPHNGQKYGRDVRMPRGRRKTKKRNSTHGFLRKCQPPA